MCSCSRRQFSLGLASLAAAVTPARADAHQAFVAAAEAMREQAMRAGDQSYGAVVVKAGAIVGYGPSRVVTSRNVDAHAEREAIKDAQRKLGADLSGCVMYSTSRPCALCEKAAHAAKISRMYFGKGPTDGGAPRG